MLRYNLDIQPEPAAVKINFNDRLIFLGSCFSEHISSRLGALHFRVASQPVGIVFNPVSLCKPFIVARESGNYKETDLLYNQDTWYSKYHHGMYSAHDKAALLTQINAAQAEFVSTLKEAEHLFITFGSAWVYSYRETGEIVANCHKIPQSAFEKRLLQPHEIISAWTEVLNYIYSVNEKISVVFTVSPVKHLRDGAVENTLSKSILLYSVYELVRQFPQAGYFPSYELVNDDLRDYRFYEPDGAHPNQLAIDYVFEKFCSAHMDAITSAYIRDMEKHLRLMSHKPIRQQGREYEQFLLQIENSRTNIEKLYGRSL